LLANPLVATLLGVQSTQTLAVISMRTPPIAALLFVLGFALVGVTYATVDVYLLGRFDRMLGRGISFSIALNLIAAGALLAGLPFLGVLVRLRATVHPVVCLLMGGVAFGGTAGLLWVAARLSGRVVVYPSLVVAVAIVIGGICAAVLAKNLSTGARVFHRNDG
jgi:hypothetical protein